MKIPFLIFSTPRSCSTLLMRILDSTPRVRCAGECNDFLWKIYDLHNKRDALLASSPHSFFPLVEQIARHRLPSHLNHSTTESWNAVALHILEGWINPPADSLAWGMKDVHVAKEGEAYGLQLWSWLQRVIPDLKLIFLTRSQDAILESMARAPSWWIPSYASSEAQWVLRLSNQQIAFGEYHALNSSSTILLDSTDVLDSKRLETALTKLGIPFCLETFNKQLAIKI